MSKTVITFDLWDTVFIDDSDEADRAARGLASKRETRRQLVHTALNSADAIETVTIAVGTIAAGTIAAGTISRASVDIAYATADAAYDRVWHEHAVTWTVPERLRVVLKGLGRSLPDARFAELVAEHEDMELRLPPHLADGITEALAQLAARYTLGIVSDTIFSPGRALRQVLANYGLLQHFSAFAFSDEVGCSKPAAGMFEAIAAQTGASLSDIIHIGDRVSKDIDGAHAVGARGVLTTVVKKRNEVGGAPDAHCDDYRQLMAAIYELV